MNSNSNIIINALKKQELEKFGIFKRKDNTGSTEFTYTRFLAPYLNNYEGYAVFCDSDFLWNCDIIELLHYIKKTEYAVMCVQHDYTICPTKKKMDGQVQEHYPRKNWSSLMVFNCSHPSTKNLTVEAVNNQSPAWLHRMNWCKDEEIGNLPIEYNYLVGYYHKIPRPKAIHYTDGGPWYKDYKNVDYAEDWLNYLSDNETTQLNQYYIEQSSDNTIER
jgi:lipopolysaccharide biosynthesis glycosyltransferase